MRPYNGFCEPVAHCMRVRVIKRKGEREKQALIFLKARGPHFPLFSFSLSLSLGVVYVDTKYPSAHILAQKRAMHKKGLIPLANYFFFSVEEDENHATGHLGSELPLDKSFSGCPITWLSLSLFRSKCLFSRERMELGRKREKFE